MGKKQANKKILIGIIEYANGYLDGVKMAVESIKKHLEIHHKKVD